MIFSRHNPSDNEQAKQFTNFTNQNCGGIQKNVAPLCLRGKTFLFIKLAKMP